MARRASRTPARSATPASTRASALLATTMSSSCSGLLAETFWTPKLPETPTNPPTVAFSPVRMTAD